MTTSFEVGDMLVYTDMMNSQHILWRIEGIYLGAEGQESLIELRNLTQKSGSTSTGVAATTFVPEPLVRNQTVYRKVNGER